MASSDFSFLASWPQMCWPQPYRHCEIMAKPIHIYIYIYMINRIHHFLPTYHPEKAMFSGWTIPKRPSESCFLSVEEWEAMVHQMPAPAVIVPPMPAPPTVAAPPTVTAPVQQAPVQQAPQAAAPSGVFQARPGFVLEVET